MTLSPCGPLGSGQASDVLSLSSFATFGAQDDDVSVMRQEEERVFGYPQSVQLWRRE